MYEIGEYLVKPMEGLCKIEDILHLDVEGIDKNRLYYLLRPMEEKNRTIYVPVDTTDSGIRKAMTEEEAWQLIEKIPGIEEIWVSNEKIREQIYKEKIKSCHPEDLVAIIKVTYQRRKKRMDQGKKSTIADDRFFRIAENHLYSELAFALQKDKSEICQLIKDTVDKKI